MEELECVWVSCHDSSNEMLVCTFFSFSFCGMLTLVFCVGADHGSPSCGEDVRWVWLQISEAWDRCGELPPSPWQHRQTLRSGGRSEHQLELGGKANRPPVTKKEFVLYVVLCRFELSAFTSLEVVLIDINYYIMLLFTVGS